jgi:molecular chaperone GrpE
MKHKDKVENLKEEKEVEIEKQESSDIIDDNTGTIDEAAVEVEELKTKVDNLQKELDDYKDRLVRKIAEFDNYKRRTENEQNNLIRYSGESFVKKFSRL